MDINKVAVLGAGIMGCDIALDLALHNLNVFLYDISEDQLFSAKNKIEQQYKLYKMLNPENGKTLEEIFSSIESSSAIKGIIGVDFVIENIIESWEEKKNLYLNINEVISDKTVVASNTSCVPINKIAALMKFPASIIGTHFMNPVPFKKFVEVIKGEKTSADTIEATKSLLKTLDKKCVVVNDAPGFVSNRVLMLTINESIRTVEEGIARPADVDKIFKYGFSHSMGPLATADLIGLDTIMFSLIVLYEEFQDPKYKPCQLLMQMVESGTLGKKTGKGFYNY